MPVAQTLLVSRPLPLALTVTVASNIWLRQEGRDGPGQVGQADVAGAGTALTYVTPLGSVSWISTVVKSLAAGVVELDLVLVGVADLDQLPGGRLADRQTAVEGDAVGVVVAPDVILAAAVAAGVAAEGVHRPLGAAGRVEDAPGC